jgi:hypothetical protein
LQLFIACAFYIWRLHSILIRNRMILGCESFGMYIRLATVRLPITRKYQLLQYRKHIVCQGDFSVRSSLNFIHGWETRTGGYKCTSVVWICLHKVITVTHAADPTLWAWTEDYGRSNQRSHKCTYVTYQSGSVTNKTHTRNSTGTWIYSLQWQPPQITVTCNSFFDSLHQQFTGSWTWEFLWDQLGQLFSLVQLGID